MANRFGTLAAVSRDAVLRRLEAAFLIFAFGEWSTWVAIIVYAYGRGGAGEAGIVAFAELAPSVIVVPLVAGLGDRFPRDRVLLGSYVAQAAAMGATGVALLANWEPILVYPLAALSATLVSTGRPLHAALMPEVVTSPDRLTAANVVSGMAESTGSLIGPIGAGLLIGVGGPAAVLIVAAAGNVIASLAVLSVARARPVDGALQRAAHEPVPTGPGQSVARPGHLDLLMGGLRAIWADRHLRAVVAIATWATFVVGAMDILYAVLALDLLGLDPGWVGYVGALGGIGAMLGSGAGLVLVGRERIAVALAASAILFGGAIALIAVAPGIAAPAVLLIIGGLGSGLTNVGAQTLIQRLAGDDVMSRVFGVLQGLMMGTTALGALIVPIVIGLVGNRGAFAVAGLSLPIVIVVVGRVIVRSDRRDPQRVADLRLLRGIPMLSPLSGPVLERLASGVSRTVHPAGSVIIRQGDPGDRFYVVSHGTLEVTIDGREARHLRPGDGFGEIALLRDVPRTATVTALDDVTLLGLDRGPFLEALTGQARSGMIARRQVDDVLAADGSRA